MRCSSLRHAARRGARLLRGGVCAPACSPSPLPANIYDIAKRGVGTGSPISIESGDVVAVAVGLREQRLHKIASMREVGEEPYAYSFDRTCSAGQLHRDYAGIPDGEEATAGEVVRFAGRIMSKRFFGKKLAFLSAQDDTGIIQMYIERANIGEERFERLRDFLDVGDHIGVVGPMKRTNKGELSVKVTEWYMLSKALSPLPDKYHGLVDVETRYRHRQMDMIMNPNVREVFRARAMVMRRLRSLLDARGFLEVDTPVLTCSPGGADAAPFLTHHNALDMHLSLRIATELHLKRLVVGGLDRVYEIGRIFRNEGLSTRHNPEFTSVELYQAYADCSDMMNITEEIFGDIFNNYKHVDAAAAAAAESTVSDPLKIVYQSTPVDLTFPWRRVTMDALVKEITGIDFLVFYESNDLNAARDAAIAAGVPSSEAHEVGSIGEIMNLVFEHACESSIVDPTFVTDHPVEISPLARTHRLRGPAFTERFELFILGREYANAFSELTDPVDQRQRFEAQLHGGADGKGGDTRGVDEEFLHALETGLPPTGGLGIGLDRVVMLLTDSGSIKDVIPFPLMRPESSGSNKIKR